MPSLIVVGADDTPFLAASDYMAAKIPGAQKVVIPAAGHAVNIDQPQAFIDAVLPFLDGLDRQRQEREGRIMKTAALWPSPARGSFAPAAAQQLPPIGGPYPPPFTETLSNNTPLAFGMDADEAAQALGTPLNYVRGRPGEEIFLAFRNIGGSGLFYQEGPAVPAVPQGQTGRLEGRLGPQLDVAIAAPSHIHATDFMQPKTRRDDPWDRISN